MDTVPHETVILRSKAKCHFSVFDENARLYVANGASENFATVIVLILRCIFEICLVAKLQTLTIEIFSLRLSN